MGPISEMMQAIEVLFEKHGVAGLAPCQAEDLAESGVQIAGRAPQSRHDRSVKAAAIQRLLAGRKPVAVAEEFGVGVATVRTWGWRAGLRLGAPRGRRK